MTLQRAVFFAGIAAYAATLTITTAVIIGAAINIFGWARLDLTIPTFLIGICLLFRLICGLWLNRLGGIPAEFKAK